MYDAYDLDCAEAQAEPAPLSEPANDRRRPGRPQHVSPALIPLLRNPAGMAIADDALPAPTARALRRIVAQWVAPWVVFERWVWVSLGIWTSTIAAIWLVTGRVSLVALAGGIILLCWMGSASRSEAVAAGDDAPASAASDADAPAASIQAQPRTSREWDRMGMLQPPRNRSVQLV
jgi:hypothetical protein